MRGRRPELARSRGLLLLAGARLALLLAACVPLPLALPPARVSLSASEPLAWSARVDGSSPQRPSATPAFELRTALEPLQLLPGLRDRRYELGLGYLLRTPDAWRATAAHHGPFVEVGAYPWRTRLAEGRLRLGVLGSADLLLPSADDAQAPGAGASLTLGLDWSTWLDEGTPVADTSGEGAFVGWAFGEVGVGLVAGGWWQRTAARDLWGLSLGLQLRTPGVLGLALVPITEFL